MLRAPVRWWSSVLAEEILLIPAGWDVDLWLLSHPDAPRDIVTYTAQEVAELEGATAAGLRLLHETKRLFGGVVLPAKIADSPLNVRKPNIDARQSGGRRETRLCKPVCKPR